MIEVPDDLTVEYHGGILFLRSGDRVAELDILKGRHNAFEDGPIQWQTFYMRYLMPALWQLTKE